VRVTIQLIVTLPLVTQLVVKLKRGIKTKLAPSTESDRRIMNPNLMLRKFNYSFIAVEQN